jgi:hypothetical protein
MSDFQPKLVSEESFKLFVTNVNYYRLVATNILISHNQSGKKFKDIAIIFNISDSSVQKYITNGKLPSVETAINIIKKENDL